VPRIIAGTAGGRALTVPTGAGTRPTADRVKEALFSALDAAPGLAGRRVLDLYAGSGALGLEAASRGAAVVTLVEHAPAALRALRSNVASLALAGVSAVGAEVGRWLAAGAPDAAYDVVLLDPPYALDVDPVLASLNAGSWLAPGATVVVERSARGPSPVWPEGLEGVRERRYNEVRLCYGRRP
jgi:16S rRNA (guanine966-N2)-methyltransferase